MLLEVNKSQAQFLVAVILPSESWQIWIVYEKSQALLVVLVYTASYLHNKKINPLQQNPTRSTFFWNSDLML